MDRPPSINDVADMSFMREYYARLAVEEEAKTAQVDIEVEQRFEEEAKLAKVSVEDFKKIFTLDTREIYEIKDDHRTYILTLIELSKAQSRQQCVFIEGFEEAHGIRFNIQSLLVTDVVQFINLALRVMTIKEKDVQQHCITTRKTGSFTLRRAGDLSVMTEVATFGNLKLNHRHKLTTCVICALMNS